MRSIAIFLILLASCTASNGTDVGFKPPGKVTVSGTIRNALTGAPLQAKLTVGEERIETAEDGTFFLEAVPVGTRLFRAEAEGYRIVERELVVPFTGLDMDLLLFPSGAGEGRNGSGESPSITDVSPVSARPGATVTVAGANFGAEPAGSQVLFAGVPAQVTSWSENSISAVVPDLNTGLVQLHVVVSGATSPAFSFTVLADGVSAPSITGLSTLTGPAGSTLTISGTAFGSTQGASTVSFGGLAAQALTWTDTSVTVVVPSALTEGALGIVVVVGGVASTSTAFTVSAPVVTTPAAPQNVAAQANTAYQISVLWTDASDNETHFDVERKQGVGVFVKVAQVGANFGQFTDFGVEPQLTYTYRVVAVNTAGAQTSAEVGLTTPADTTGGGLGVPPDAPSAAVASVQTAFLTRLAWSSNSGGQESGFWIQRNIDGGGYSWIGSVVSGVTTFDDETVVPGHTYAYRVRAFNTAGSSVYATSNSVTTPEVVPLAPGNLVATAVSPYGVVISWNDYADNETGAVVQRQVGGGSFTDLLFVGPDVVFVEDDSALPGMQYGYRVRAVNATGASAYSQTAGVYTPDVAPGGPSALTITVAPAMLTVNWLDESDNEIGFRIYRSEGAGPSILLATVNAGVVQYADAAIRSGQEYTYHVAAYNTAGESAGATASATAPLMAPDQPETVAVSPLSNTQALLTWTNGAVVGSEIRILRALGSGSFSQIATLGGTATAYLDGGLAASTSYRWKVVAANASYATESAIASATTPAPGTTGGGSGTAPAAPSNLQGSINDPYLYGYCGYYGGDMPIKSGIGVSLQWLDQSSDELGFVIESNDGSGWKTVRSTSPNATGISLTAIDGVQTRYRVQAYGAGGASATTNEATLDVPLRAPECLVASPRGVAGVYLEWVNQGHGTLVEVQRRLRHNTVWQTIATVDADVEYYHDATAESRKNYVYRVKSLGSSAYAISVSTPSSNFFWKSFLPGALGEEYCCSSDSSVGVWADDDTFAVAVGANKVFGFDDGVWYPMEVPMASRRLNAVWGSGQTDIWAVGMRGVILHYDGFEWSRWPTQPRGALDAIWGSSASDVWAAGRSYEIDGVRLATMLHFDGAEWQAVSLPVNRDITALWGSASDNVWAIGEGGLVLHWAGSSWSVVPAPTSYTITSVAGGTDGLPNIASLDGAIYKYTGAAWNRIREADYVQVLALEVDAADVLFASLVSYTYDYYSTVVHSSVEQYDGGWSTVFAHDMSEVRFVDLAATSGGGMFAIAPYGALRVTGAAATTIDRFTGQVLGIEGTSSGRVVAVHEAGAVAYQGGATTWYSAPPTPPVAFAANDVTIYTGSYLSDGEPLYYANSGDGWEPGPLFSASVTRSPSPPTYYVGSTIRLPTALSYDNSAYSPRLFAGAAYIAVYLQGMYISYETYNWNSSLGSYQYSSSTSNDWESVLQVYGLNGTLIHERALYNSSALGFEQDRLYFGNRTTYALSSTDAVETSLLAVLPTSYWDPLISGDATGAIYISDNDNWSYGQDFYRLGVGEWVSIGQGSKISGNQTGEGYLYLVASDCCGTATISGVSGGAKTDYLLPSNTSSYYLRLLFENATTPWVADRNQVYRLE